MEVIHLILGKANPSRMNGVNRVVHELASRQNAAGVHAEVWGITADMEHNYPARNYKTRLFQAQRNPFSLANALKDAIYMQYATGTVFHLHGGFIPAFYTAAGLLKQHNIPYVFTPHGSYNRIAMLKNGMIKKLYFRLLERRLINTAQVIHSLGKSEMAGLQSIFPNNKSVLIPYGFDVPEEKHFAPNTATFRIAYCGRLDIHTKGLDELLTGFKTFHEYHQDSSLWMIGEGEGMVSLKKMAAGLSLGDAIVFHGARYGQEKSALLRQCHVFAAPSRNEGLPTAVIEAASLGLVSLVTDATNMGDHIQQYDAGVVIGATCPVEVNKGLSILYDRIKVTGDGPVMSSNAQRMITEVFNWNTIIKAFQKLYAC